MSEVHLRCRKGIPVPGGWRHPHAGNVIEGEREIFFLFGETPEGEMIFSLAADRGTLEQVRDTIETALDHDPVSIRLAHR